MSTKVKITNDMPADSGTHSIIVTANNGEHIVKPGESYDGVVYDGASLTIKNGPATHTGPSTHS